MIVARHYETGQWLAIDVPGDRIASVAPADPAPSEVWVAPAFWDVQTNGGLGVSYSDPALTVEQVAETVRARAETGVARLCPTLITASFEAMRHGVATIARACELLPDVARMVVGIHLEGPSISALDGYRGAHPLDDVRGPDWDELERLQEASGGRVVLVTLAPERPGALAFIARAKAAGITVALGHTAADPATIDAAVTAGATLSTHLGNGIASPLPRHPNPIWIQAADDRLAASFIADGHHLDRAVLRVLLRSKGLGRSLLVSDASPLAGLPPGDHGAWSVDPSGKVIVTGTPYLAGSCRGLDFAVNEVLNADPSLSLAVVLAMTSANPARALGRPCPSLAPGEPANLIVFDTTDRFRLRATCVDGTWTVATTMGSNP